MMFALCKKNWRLAISLILAITCLAGVAVIAQTVPMTLEDFHLSGTQVGDISPAVITTSDSCAACHGNFDPSNEPYNTWRGSLMGQAGRDPLFLAQMTTANQDVANVGYFCMRCHVPMTFLTQNAYVTDGSAIDEVDRDGVNCHLCHSMVDPIYEAGVSPSQDKTILAAMGDIPGFYGNSQFVLDPNGLRRGPYADAQAGHAFVQSDFHKRGDVCGTCHDVGNIAVTRLSDGTYRYNNLNEATPTENLADQFPLERTYTEWKLSSFANGGVDMGGRFGGQGITTVSTCQDCHMPKTTARGCFYGPERTDLARHDFAGASAWVLKIIAKYYEGDPEVDQQAMAGGQANVVSMVQRAASLELEQECGAVRTRVTNESGHKLPTGHIEGRRVWVNVRCFDVNDNLIREYGHYDPVTAELDEESTDIYEMHVGLSDYASFVTGYPPGVTTHMALADVIEKDTRIPPRGFNNAMYGAAGAPTVKADYADGQYWDDTEFWLPDDAVKVLSTVYYQTVTRHYIEALHAGNHTDHWGETLYQLWLETDKGAPIAIVTAEMAIAHFVRGDANDDGWVNVADFRSFFECWNGPLNDSNDGCRCGDFDGNDTIDLFDYGAFQNSIGDS